MLTNFYLSTWEEYHTHTLYLSEFSGPVEGILIVCVSLILTGIYGKQVIWHTYLFTITVGDKVIDVDTLDIVFSLAVFGLVMNALSAKRNVDKYYRNSTSSANNITQIEQDSAIKGLLPFFCLLCKHCFTSVDATKLYYTLFHPFRWFHGSIYRRKNNRLPFN